MITKLEFIERFRIYVDMQINSICGDSFMGNFLKPLIKRGIDNKLSEVESFVNLFVNKDGNIDIEGIIDEMTTNVIQSKPFTKELGELGNIEIGDGKIKLNIPSIDKRLVYTESDFKILRDLLTNK